MTHTVPPAKSECLKTYFLLAKPQLSKLKLDIPKMGLGNEEGFETHSRVRGNDNEVGLSEVSK